MKSRIALSLAVLLASAPAALALQDVPPAPKPVEPVPPPVAAPAAPAAPARHENQITDAAKGAIEAYKKVVYSPVDLGLKDFKGTLVMKMTMPGMEEGAMEGMGDMSVRFAVAYTAPRTIAIEASTDNPMLAQNMDQMKKQVEQIVLYGLGVLEPPQAEYDMDLVTEAGVKILVIKTYDKAVAQGEMRLSLDANGLPSKATAKITDPNSGMEQSVDFSFTYVKDGERHRLERQTVSIAMFPEPFLSVFTYVDAEGLKILAGVQMQGPMGMSFSYAYTDLTVNGKKVTLPEAGKKKEPAATDGAETEKKPAPEGGEVPPK